MEKSAMQRITLRSHVDSDGVLRLEIPTSQGGAEVEVTVTFNAVAPSQGANENTPEELGWSPGFFEQTAGALADDPIERGEQGEYEQRPPLDDN